MKNFIGMGGGVKKGVLDRSTAKFAEIEKSTLSMSRKLLAGHEQIMLAGGEVKPFATSVLIADVPGRSDLVWANSLISGTADQEVDILKNVNGDLKKAGLQMFTLFTECFALETNASNS
ncbi:MAG: hypothetical protein H7222_06535 [Methylotenera sp.]|nr:hypothetical protein [Oligoflexia bacterium]